MAGHAIHLPRVDECALPGELTNRRPLRFHDSDGHRGHADGARLEQRDATRDDCDRRTRELARQSVRRGNPAASVKARLSRATRESRGRNDVGARNSTGNVTADTSCQCVHMRTSAKGDEHTAFGCHSGPARDRDRRVEHGALCRDAERGNRQRGHAASARALHHGRCLPRLRIVHDDNGGTERPQLADRDDAPSGTAGNRSRARGSANRHDRRDVKRPRQRSAANEMSEADSRASGDAEDDDRRRHARPRRSNRRTADATRSPCWSVMPPDSGNDSTRSDTISATGNIPRVRPNRSA